MFFTNLGNWQRNREARNKVSKILVKTYLKSTINVLLLASLTIECPTKVNCQMLQMFLLKIQDEFRSDFQKLPWSPFSTLLFRCRRRKIMTAKLYFCVPSPLKKLVLALQSLKMSCFYFTFCSWSYKTTNKVSGWRNFSPATAKYVSGKRAWETRYFIKMHSFRRWKWTFCAVALCNCPENLSLYWRISRQKIIKSWGRCKGGFWIIPLHHMVASVTSGHSSPLNPL